MILFEIPKEENKADESAGGGKNFTGEHLLPKSNKLEDVLDLLRNDCCIHWVSEGDWNMHDLLLGLLHYSGAADVWLSSYAFSEYPARLIADLKDRKMIRKLYCLIDSRIDVRSAGALAIIRNIATKLKMVNTHAKVTVIENKKMMIAIVGSANYTTNKRYEAGMIVIEKEAANFHKNWMRNELEKD